MKNIVFLIFGIILVGCTDNQRARKFGGSEVVKLKPNEILVNVTWKESNLWLLTKDTITNTLYFREKSNWGLFDGQIEFHGEK
jgi:hypothetical protein